MAEQVVGFLQQFLEVFPTLGGKKLYLAGESVRDLNPTMYQNTSSQSI